MSIFTTIRQENDSFYRNDIVLVPGYSFNQYETLKRIHLYLDNKFEDATSYLGRDKLFFDVVTAPCEVATRMLNLDTKDIRLWPENPKSEFGTFLLEKELKSWLKISKMARILNDIAEELPRYGSVVIEKTPTGAEIVDLRKLCLDPSVDRIKDSRFITTIHYMKPEDLRKTGWHDVETAINRFGNTASLESFEDMSTFAGVTVSTPYIKIYKRYGLVPKYELEGGKSEEMVPAIFIVAGADYMIKGAEGKPVEEAGIVLYKSAWKKAFPFQDFHYSKRKGRWLGVGVVEKLFDVQVRMNELKNQKRVSMEISAMHLFQTPDKQIVRNVLTDLENGDMIISPNGITPMATEERNLPAFDGEETSYRMQADRLSFAYEAVRGESMSASTPATNALIANQGATSVYEFKRENLAIDLREFFNDMVMPQLLKDLTPEHIMIYIGTSAELEKIDKAAIELFANDVVKGRILKGEIITPATIELAKMKRAEQLRKMGDKRSLSIKQAFYKDIEYQFDFMIAPEQADPATMVQNTQTVLMAIAQNPAMLQDPRVKMLFYEYASKLGVSPAKIELADQQANANPLLEQGMPLENMIPRTNVPQSKQTGTSNMPREAAGQLR